MHTIAKAALKRTVRWERVYRNVAEAAEPPKVQRKEVKVLTLPQVIALLRAASSKRLEAFYIVALTTDLREGVSARDAAYRAVLAVEGEHLGRGTTGDERPARQTVEHVAAGGAV